MNLSKEPAINGWHDNFKIVFDRQNKIRCLEIHLHHLQWWIKQNLHWQRVKTYRHIYQQAQPKETILLVTVRIVIFLVTNSLIVMIILWTCLLCYYDEACIQSMIFHQEFKKVIGFLSLYCPWAKWFQVIFAPLCSFQMCIYNKQMLQV